MADVYFPDGTKLSDLAPNTANLLASLTPSFSGWAIEPGTNVDMVNELFVTLTTAGVFNSGIAKLTYNLGTSKRIIGHIFAGFDDFNYCNWVGVNISDDGLIYYPIASSEYCNTPFYARSLTFTGKCKHIEFMFYCSNYPCTIPQLTMRVYNL